MYKVIFAVSIIILSCGNVFADFIKLKNGQTASTKILDTVDCDVSILRKDKPVNIDKKLIDFIVINNDTTKYTNYNCKPSEKTPAILEISDENLIPESQIDLLKAKVNTLQTEISKLNKEIALRDNVKNEGIKKRLKVTFGISQILAGVTAEILSIREFSVTKKDYEKAEMDTDKNIKELRLNLFKLTLLSAAVTVGGVVIISF